MTPSSHDGIIAGDHAAEVENMKRCGICNNYKARSGLCHIDNDIVNRADKCRFNPSEWEMIEE